MSRLTQRFVALVILLMGVGAFLSLSPAAEANGSTHTASVGVNIQNLYGVSVHIGYPMVVRALATVLNSTIQRWIGSHCSDSLLLRGQRRDRRSASPR
jgi:hypothetical protein